MVRDPLRLIRQAAEEDWQELDLSFAQLSSLPTEIGKLTNLTSLNLNNARLSSLPTEIRKLTNLTSLNLSDTPLRNLPPEIIGQLTNLTSLNLSNTQLSSLPTEIGQLTNLILLDLSNTPLRSLPSEIGQLINLTLLDLGDTRLSNLPTEIGQLINLTLLNLSNIPLGSLPTEIGQLTHLTSLNLSNIPLGSLPTEIGQLTNLILLDLSNTPLRNLPLEIIGRLTNLTSLNLSGTPLRSLPPEIGKLTQLTSLDLSFTPLRNLPLEIIGQLTNLTSLNLSLTLLRSLPPEIIGQLTNLTSFDLSATQISSLPPEIGQLTQLTSLDLRKTQISSLPPEIGQLTQLNSLNLSLTPLRSLPPEIGKLTHLTSFDLSATQLSNLPLEISKYCNNPAEAAVELPRYYRQILEQKIEGLYEAKLLIVGEPGAGKTSLAKKIEDHNYELKKDETSTEGIDIVQWKFSLENGEDFRVNIWDFGGQEIYHATHQFFLTKRSLYALVADTRKEDTDFFYWLNVVELLSNKSPTLIVKNEKQDRKRELNEQQLRQFTNLKEILPTNLKTNRGLDDILTAIKYHIQTLPHVGNELPKTWVDVRRALEEDSRSYISIDEFLNICEQNGFTRWEDKLQLSGFLHDLGVCLHFQEDDLLRKTIILKPTWGTHAVYKVLDNPQVIENLGQFTKSNLASIWHESDYAPMRAELLQLMINFKLCYEIPSNPGTYIAPQLLTENQPDYHWDESSNLILRYEYDFMPKGLLTRFIVETHPYIEEQSLVWRSGVVLGKDGARLEAVEYYRYHKGEIWLRVTGKRQKELLTIARYEFKKIHDSYERLKYSELVPCNCATCKNTQSPHFYRLSDLYRRLDNNRQQVECEQSYEFVLVRSLIDEIVDNKPSENDDSDDSLMDDSLTIPEHVFISYSHRDPDALRALQTHLKPMVQNQSLKVWADNQIQAGAEWRGEIEAALTAAKVAVLLVSPDFLASDFIANNELPPLLDAAKKRGLTIIWVPFRSSSYKETEIERYQAAWSPERPIRGLSEAEQDKAWVRVCEQIKEAYEQ